MTFFRAAKIFITILILVAYGIVIAIENEKPSPQTIYEQRATTYAAIGPEGVTATLNRFILFRKGAHGCALRFSSFRREGENKPASFFRSGWADTWAEYDWYFQDDGTFDLSKTNVQSGHGKLRWGSDFRLGHGLILGGPKDANRSIDCGSFHVAWGYPMNLAFYSFARGKTEYDPQLEFAPTRWTKLEQLDFSNSGLRWISGLAAGKIKEEVWIPLEDLP